MKNKIALIKILSTHILIIMVIPVILNFFVSVFYSPVASAAPLSQSELYALDNYTNWVATSGSVSGCTALTGNTNGQAAYNYFIGKGLTPAGASGIVGNMTEESVGVDPERLQSYFTQEEPAESPTVQNSVTNPTVGWGIVQWTPASKIITVSEKQGTSDQTIDTLAFQLNFLWTELQSPYYARVIPDLKAASTPEAAADAFLSDFERGDPSPAREAYARAYYNLAVNNLPLPSNVPVSTNQGGGTGTVSGCNQTASGNGSYMPPFRDVAKLTPTRIDQGVDYDGTGPVYALGDGTVVNISSSGWPNNTFIVYKLSSGPASGKFVYVAEDCTPSVTQGEAVTSSTPICTMFNGPTGLETGWAQDPSIAGTISMAYQEFQAHPNAATSFGQNFAQLLQNVGEPIPPTSNSTGGVDPITLPSGWPVW